MHWIYASRKRLIFRQFKPDAKLVNFAYSARSSDLCRSGVERTHSVTLAFSVDRPDGVCRNWRHNRNPDCIRSGLPRMITAIGALYCTGMYGLAAYAITNDRIWTTVIVLLTAVLSWEPIAGFISRRAAH